MITWSNKSLVALSLEKIELATIIESSWLDLLAFETFFNRIQTAFAHGQVLSAASGYQSTEKGLEKASSFGESKQSRRTVELSRFSVARSVSCKAKAVKPIFVFPLLLSLSFFPSVKKAGRSCWLPVRHALHFRGPWVEKARFGQASVAVMCHWKQVWTTKAMWVVGWPFVGPLCGLRANSFWISWLSRYVSTVYKLHMRMVKC